jgi:hypothetical protein
VTTIKRDIVQHFNNLKLLTEKAVPNQPALGREILAIYEDADKIQKPLNKVLGAVEAAGKDSGKNSRHTSEN